MYLLRQNSKITRDFITVSFIPFHQTRQEILGWNSGTTCIEYGRMTLMVVTLSICGMVEQKKIHRDKCRRKTKGCGGH